jgi:hypothetical protein
VLRQSSGKNSFLEIFFRAYQIRNFRPQSSDREVISPTSLLITGCVISPSLNPLATLPAASGIRARQFRILPASPLLIETLFSDELFPLPEPNFTEFVVASDFHGERGFLFRRGESTMASMSIPSSLRPLASTPT